MGKDSQLRARGAVQGKNQSPCDAKRKIAMATIRLSSLYVVNY